jgi:predicted ABC-type ATPase
MPDSAPHVVVLAGPNGAGKSTLAPLLLRDKLAVTEFVNADDIARGLSGFGPDGVALEASRIMLARLRVLADARESFAFETTLASRSYAPWLRQLAKQGFDLHLLFLWLPKIELALTRVIVRVRLGGHGVPADIVRRRFRAGIRNFFALYRPLATTWRVYDNSGTAPDLVASGEGDATIVISDRRGWARFVRGAQ